MPPTTEKFQFAITKHFESAHSIRKVGFRLYLDQNDFWETFREESPGLLPPRRHEMRVYPAGFDTRLLTSADIRKLKTLAAANGFHYAGADHARNNQIFFIECQSPAESLGQELAATWAMEKPFRTLPKIDGDITPDAMIEAVKIFLRFIKSHDDTLDLDEIKKASRITTRFLKKCNIGLILADNDLMELLEYVDWLNLMQTVLSDP